MAKETPVEIIPLTAPLNQPQAELSGLSWCGDRLILLPQYPERVENNDASFFYYLERQQIIDYLDEKSSHALTPKRILIHENKVRDTVSVFEGYEAIACSEDKVWLSIESIDANGVYQSVLVPGDISFAAQAAIKIEPQGKALLRSQSNLRNIGDEAIVMHGSDVIAIHEVNSRSAVKSPNARRLSNSLETLKFPPIPFRITDASSLDQANRFWVINYKYSGDDFSRNTQDPISIKYGQGNSHKKYYNVERLLQLALEDNQIKLLDSKPISLEMTSSKGRNWEGLARLENRGFLLVTDRYPNTLLGFVPYTE